MLDPKPLQDAIADRLASAKALGDKKALAPLNDQLADARKRKDAEQTKLLRGQIAQTKDARARHVAALTALRDRVKGIDGDELAELVEALRAAGVV